MKFFEVLTCIAAVIGALLLLMAFTARMAPAQGAAAAMAAAIVIIPYCVARLLQGRATLNELIRQRRNGDVPPPR